jgi:DNA (cytosine-5)-methyltransferase 1
MTDGHRLLVSPHELEEYLARENIVYSPADHKRKRTEIPEVVAVSFFSGALGLDLGMERAGIESLMYCECDRKCRMTIAANRPDGGLLGDIIDADAEMVRETANIPKERKIDVMFGGPPCQAFSTAGARRAFDDARGNVFLRYLELADELKPTYLVIENVRGLLSAPWPLKKGGRSIKGGALNLILKELRHMGYAVTFDLYNAANFGAPQIRERVILIGKRGKKPVAHLTPTNSDDASFGLSGWNSFGDAIEGLDSTRCRHTDFPESRLKYLKMLSEGQYWKDLPQDVQAAAMGKSYELSGGKTGFYRRISFSKPCPTLVTAPTMPATYLAHPTEDRPLSVEEYKRVQGFPDDWVICGNLTDQYKQIGNAVPVALGCAVGRTIMDDIHGIKREIPVGFSNSRYTHTSEKTWAPSV